MYNFAKMTTNTVDLRLANLPQELRESCTQCPTCGILIFVDYVRKEVSDGKEVYVAVECKTAWCASCNATFEKVRGAVGKHYDVPLVNWY